MLSGGFKLKRTVVLAAPWRSDAVPQLRIVLVCRALPGGIEQHNQHVKFVTKHAWSPKR
jgi:hypothetical protein